LWNREYDYHDILCQAQCRAKPYEGDYVDTFPFREIPNHVDWRALENSDQHQSDATEQ
jgi:hypothetical protein